MFSLATTTFVLGLVLSASALTEEDRVQVLQKEKNALIKCQKERNAPETYIEDILIKHKIPDDKCFGDCFLREIKWKVKDDDINLEGVKYDLERLYYKIPEVAIRIVEGSKECVKVDNNDKCGMAHTYLSCTFKKFPLDVVPPHVRGH